MNTCNYAAIMAGGCGERFWPQSRISRPKQLLRLLGNLTLIEQTIARLLPLFEPERILIITNRDYVAPMRSLISAIPPENIVGEPIGKDTAVCAAFAAATIRAKASACEDPLLCFFPADHIIHDKAAFQQNIRDCLAFMENSKSILTIGVEPTSPSIGYGYIETGDPIDSGLPTAFHKALSFREKPDLATAEAYLKTGRFKWNAGAFFLHVSTIQKAFREFAPEIASVYERMLAVLQGGSKETMELVYSSAPRISFDYAVMERCRDIAVADCSFEWDDAGTWSSMRNQIAPGENNNVVRGIHVGLDTTNSTIITSPAHLIATVDLDDVIIVHTDDATLVCNGKSAQRIKELLKLIEARPELRSFL